MAILITDDQENAILFARKLKANRTKPKMPEKIKIKNQQISTHDRSCKKFRNMIR